MNESKKSNKGGARRGAGRPAEYKGKLMTKNIRLPAVFWDRLNLLAKSEGKSLTRWIYDKLGE